ncbi:MAG: LacI family DNA-binding transcriptional regulator [Anaerolineae bacterium]|nr:LacI family DNA-binding transcriptional regulator [Anaerolineae bacterium]
MMRNNATIQDIARRAGVGTTTVSRVLNGHPYVSEATRQKVLNAIEDLGYRPSFSAQHMRTRTSRLIGFLAADVATTPYAVDMIRGAYDACWNQEHVLLVISTGENMEMAEAAVEVLLGRQVEGIVCAAMYHRPIHLPDNSRHIPTVLANCFVPDRSLPSVVPDEVQGGHDAITFALRKGHTRIGFINLSPHTNGGGPVPASKGRLQGYREALEQAGIPYDEHLVKHTNETPRANYHLTQELLALPDPPTAIFCGNDRTAMGCYGALAQMGLRIPDDVAVISFDDQIDIASGLWPPLTSMRLPHYEMGRWAVDYLLRHVQAEDALPPVQHLVECPLIERDSI